MIKTKVMDRGSGKTTLVINMMELDDSLFAIVHTNIAKKMYPSHLHHRVYVYDKKAGQDFILDEVNKVIIDEGFLMDKDELAEFYYFLGRSGIHVISIGSIDDLKSKNDNNGNSSLDFSLF